MDYSNYTIKDFLMDEFFQQWVKQPDETTEKFWTLWLAQHPEKAQTIAQARYFLLSLNFEADRLTDSQVKNIWNHIEQESSVNTKESMPKTVRFYSLPKRGLWAAAAVLALIAFSAVFYFFQMEAFMYEKYMTDFGQKKEITLPDGSCVILNAHSELKFLKDWKSQTDRNVWLNGEAFFQVAKQPATQAKFRVHTNTLTVEVLGTKFNVSHRHQNTAVTLNEGKIKLDVLAENAEKNIFMQPGDMVRFIGKEQKLTKTSVKKPENHSSWIKDYWILENTTLTEVAEKIENTYGLQVIIKNQKTAQESMDGALPTKNIRELLEVLSVTYNVHIRTTNNQVLIF